MIFDSNNDLTQEMMTQFLDKIPLTEIILVVFGNNEIVTSKQMLKNTFMKNDKIIDFSKNNIDKIIISTEDDTLIMSTDDYLWWNENTRRINKLFKSITCQENKKIVNDLIVAIAENDNDKLVNIESFTGKKQDCIQFLNKEIVIRTLKSFSKAKIEICLNYDNEYQQWFTLDELILQGVIIK